MREPDRTGTPARAIGLWSALFITAEVVVFGVSLVVPNALMIAFLASFFLAPTYVALMVAIHYVAPPPKKVWSHLGLSFAVIYAVLCSLTYYVQLTVVRSNSLGVPGDLLQVFAFTPGSVMFTQDMLGYTFLCLSTLAAAPVFSGGGLTTWIRLLFVVHGLLLFPTAIFPALSFPQDPAAVASSNQFGTYANLAWAVLFAPIAVLLAVYFKRLGGVRVAPPVDDLVGS